MNLVQTLNFIKVLKCQIVTLYFISRDKRVYFLPKIISILTLSYAMSPIDLIPDFIPILGYLDDLIVIPLGIWLVLRFITSEVWKECHERSKLVSLQIPKNYFMACFIVSLWSLILYLIFIYSRI